MSPTSAPKGNPTMSIDERALTELLAESQDLHVNAQRTALQSLDQLSSIREDRVDGGVDLDEIASFNATRRSALVAGGAGVATWLGRGLFAGGLIATLEAIMTAPANADQALDVQILQTAVSLEMLAIATYAAALELEFVKNGNKTIVAFAQTTMKQHSDHRDAFNAQTRTLGGKEQTQPNAKYLKIVEAAKPMLKTPGDVVMLAASLETVATQTYVKNASLLKDSPTKALMASVTGVEAQHLATLRAVGALLGSAKLDLITIPTAPARLPAAAGGVSFPKPFEGTEMASPPEEGAVK